MRSQLRYGIARAAVIGSLALSCGGSERNEPRAALVIPAAPLAESSQPAFGDFPEESTHIPTEVTLLKTGSVFLAYVSVPEDGSVRDLENARVNFSFRGPTKAWRPIIECQAVFTCDVSGVMSKASLPVTIQARYIPEIGSGYSFSSAEFTIR
ncbi:MAG TPA: hypothetical protein VLD37_05610 [Candidatus Bilamarchaeum sp.]|nr:hypothetical protein [Candidatus Bilamarchaeum sp.]